MAKKGGLTLVKRLRQRSRMLGQVAGALKWFLPMTRDVLSGRYRPVPWRAFGWMVVALVYLISPLDLIPDVIFLLGLVDDFFIVGWLLTRVDVALADYRLWRDALDAPVD